MRHRVVGLWRKLVGARAWLLRDDLRDTYPRPDTAQDAQGPMPDRHVNFSAPPGGGIF